MIWYINIFGFFNMTLFIVNVILSVVILFLERKNTSSSLAWLSIMIVLPGFGFFLYIMLSQNIAKRKIFRYTEEERSLYDHYLNRQGKSFEDGSFHFNDPAIILYHDHILFHNRLSESFYTQNNTIDIYTDGTQKFTNLFNDIANATHHIHIQYYIINNDDLGNKLLEQLRIKALEGIEVRLLMDFIGSRHIPTKTLNNLEKAGVKIAHFFPSKFKLFNFKANYRNHRKIVIIDGKIGYLGGFNVGDEYMGLSKRFGNWRDTHLKIVGDAVISLQIRFFLDWRLASKEQLAMTSNYMHESNLEIGAGIQIVSCGPDQQYEQIKQGFLKMIHAAKISICIQTPYFIPDDAITEALRIAASSGVNISIMIPNKPDHPFVYWATVSYLGDLLPFGIKVYTYENGFLHAKTITVDGILSSVGTCNFDLRSFKLNFEVNAFIYDSNITKRLEALFKEDLLNSEQLTLEFYENRSLFMRARERISRFFTPIL
jgi:cardiolipin synthase